MRYGFISNHYPREKGHDIAAYLEKDQRTIYAGFDPTAPSLHIGNLMVICGLQVYITNMKMVNL